MGLLRRFNLDKLNWGLIGGGDGSQVGFAHRAAAQLDGKFNFVAGALDLDPDRAREFGVTLGLESSRSYGSWQRMLVAEKAIKGKERINLVTIATPNSTHFEITKAFLESGFHVLCEKPLTMTVEEAKALVVIAKKSSKVCAVNYGYTGYPMVRQMRSMIMAGELGEIRLVVAEFAGGFMADSADAENPRVKWRFSSKQSGMAAITVDCGIHALNMACFVTNKKVVEVSSDFASGIKSRELEDDNSSAFRLETGIIGRLWTSGLAIGRTHGLTLQVFGEKGGLYWKQEQPNQLSWTPINKSTQILERGHPDLHLSARRANRITIGHPEGMVFAFANIYRDLSDVIFSTKAGKKPDILALDYPTVEDGCHSIEIVEAMTRSVANRSCWTKV